MKALFAAWTLVASVGLVAAGLVRADADAALSRQAQAVARNTMSPFCPGKTIDSCPSPRAEAWRRDIRAWLAAGATRAEIMQRLQSRAPTFDLEGRPGRGWDWLIPVGAMAVATLWLCVLWRRHRPQPKEGDSRSETLERDELDRRIDADLARLE